MPKVECFKILGLTCWFWSNGHDPPHFHVKREGEWEIKVKFAEGETEMFELEWGDAPKAKVLREIAKNVEAKPSTTAGRVGGEGKPMNTKTLERRLVEFYATSPRLALAYRHAAKHSKSLARLAGIHELGHVAAMHDLGKRAVEFQMVVLSHADDDHLVLLDSRTEPVVSGAFHLLFTGPATHPDQVAQWMRCTNIRSENRLHVVKVEDMEAPQLSQLLGRVCFALGPDGNQGGIIDAYLLGDRLFVRGLKHRMLHIPLDSIRALRGQPQAAVRNFSIDPDGSFIYWPDLDVHLGWNQFLQAVDPAELRKAQQRSAGFNERYGAAIRRVREAAGILQSKVEGLTERQLRRIEQGESRATTAAITALARAHGLDANAYMERLTKAMR